MIHIDNLKEKELVIAYYFCGNTHKQFSRYEVFDMWSNWFKKDFRINNKPVFCLVDDKLVYRKSVKIKRNDMETLRKYNRAFQNIYAYIKKILSGKGHDKAFLRQELEKERGREYKRVATVMQYMNYSQNIRSVLYVRNGRIIVISSYGMNSTLSRYECLMKHLN